MPYPPSRANAPLPYPWAVSRLIVRIVIVLNSILLACWRDSSEQGFAGQVGFGGFSGLGGQSGSCGFGTTLTILLIKETRHIGKPFYQKR